MTEGSYTILAFKDVGTCTWSVPTGVTNVDYLVVAGGGGGGADTGGGGGAGGLLSGTSGVNGLSTLSITVGGGGAGGASLQTSAGQQGANGGNSILVSSSTITAVGGGGGGAGGSDSSKWNGKNGGSGGGSATQNANTFGSGTSGQGFAGAIGISNCEGTVNTSFCGGGGGGAGAAGSVGTTSTTPDTAGSGGVGATWNQLTTSNAIALGVGEVSGSNVYFAGGGGGGAMSWAKGGPGGLGGGGAGDNISAGGGFDGVTSTGGGGGAGGRLNNSSTDISVGGDGGSGVVILRYEAQDIDYSMDFNGSTQLARSSVPGVSTAATIETWVKPESACSNAQNVLIKDDAYSIYCLSGVWRFRFKTASGAAWQDYSTGASVSQNQWQHIALARDAAGVHTFFLDGQSVFQRTIANSAWFQSSFDLGVGAYVGLTEYFNGHIDELKIWSSARTQVQVAAGMHARPDVTDANLKAYYDFNDGTGTTIYNRVQGAASTTHLTTSGSPSFVDVKTTNVLPSGRSVVTFPRSYITAAGGWTVPQGVTSADVLVVGGGGGGGSHVGGGGGGGGVREISSHLVTTGAVIDVKVGVGGSGGTTADGALIRTSATSGGDSSFGSITAAGGGRGATWDLDTPGAGGSGGGGARTPGGAGNTPSVSPSQGNSGGAAQTSGQTTYATGGGGGAGEAGYPFQSVNTSGSGGAGRASSITGGVVVYGGGGGGGVHGNYPNQTPIPGQGGLGGGGAGTGYQSASCSATPASGSCVAEDGVDGLGGGGGGSGGPYTSNASTAVGSAGGDGGSGVVILSYGVTSSGSTTCSNPSTTEASDGSGDIVVKFTTVESCAWTPPVGVTSVRALVVGGGGGGGNYAGGGAGELNESASIPVTPGVTVSVQVGSGGSGGTGGSSNPVSGATGGQSAFGTVVSRGGGGGASLNNSRSISAPGSGGSGGGAINNDNTSAESGGGATSASGVGHVNSGGSSPAAALSGTVVYIAGGGGGAAGAGVNGQLSVTTLIAGSGGAARSSTISGSVAWFAEGGAGAANCNGVVSCTSQFGTTSRGGGTNTTAGLANTGSGGGGIGSTNGVGTSGGSGVVIIRYTPADASCTPLTYTSGSYTVVEFQTAGSCTWTVPSAVTSVDVLAVGGGGGGGAWVGGGGGGGGVTETTGVTVTAGSSIDVVVGGGGVGSIQTSTFTAGSNGQSSRFGAATPVIALGGGVGASVNSQSAGTGPSVATGGGGANTSWSAGSGTGSGTTLAGGSSPRDSQPHPVGGGAGAGGNGLSGSSAAPWVSGAGGPGKVSSLTGATVHYGGGGGGSAHGEWTVGPSWVSSVVITPGVGGVGGGGAGGRVVSSAGAVYGIDGVDGLGGGGGGSANYGPAAATPSYGGDGGDGIVIVRYANQTLSKVAGDGQSGSMGSVLSTNPRVRVVDVNGNGVDGVVVTFAVVSGGGSVGSSTVTTSAGGYAETTWTLGSTGANSITATAVGVAGSPVTFTATASGAVCDVEFTELNFDFSRARLPNGNALPANHGKSQGQAVLYRNVLSRCGGVDAIVTTSALSGATVSNYEAGANAGGANSYFQADVDFSTANGFAEFTFACFRSGTVTNSAEPVLLKNVKVTAIDIDYYQFNDFTGMDAFTVANNTRLVTQNRVPASGFPLDARFQGPSGFYDNSPQDQVVATYGDVDVFKIRFGRSRSGSPNYFGVAFKELGWGSSTPVTSVISYTISYDANDATSGLAPVSQSAALGGNVTLRSNTGSLVRTGYTFGGWNTAADGSGTSYLAGAATYMPQDGMVLYAVWTPVSYTVTYNANGGSGAPTGGSAVFASTVTVSSSTPTRSGFDFLHWTTTSAGTGVTFSANSTFSMPASNVTLFAQWEARSVVLTYDKNTGDAVSSMPVSVSANAGSTVTLSANTPTRTGYDFTGWNTQANGSGTSYVRSSGYVMPSTSATLYAQWQIKSYTLTYNLNGGTGTTPASQTGNYDTTVSARSTVATRTGYTFAGWTVNQDGTGASYQPSDSYTLVTNATLYANWTPIQYTIFYAANDDVANPASNLPTAQPNIVYQQSVSLSATIPTRTGYIFNGWGYSGSSYVASSSFVMPANDVTLSAQWIPDNFDLLYSANGGTGAPAATEHEFQSTAVISGSVPTRTGHTFLYWTTTSAGTGTTFRNPASGGSVTSFTMPAQHVTLYAQWQVNQYTVTYSANLGTGAPGQQTESFGGTVTVSGTTPTRDGYQFMSWDTLPGGGGTAYAPGGTFVMPANNVTLYAQWQALTYQLVYNVNGGTSTAPPAQSGTTGSQLSVSNTTPTRAGYTFTGWNTAVTGSATTYQSGDSLTMPPFGVTLYAQWTANPFVVAYHANNGSDAPSNQTQVTDSLVTVSNGTPTRTGYTFTGWNTAANGSGTAYQVSDTFTMPPNNVTLYAQWTADSFTVSYDANGGTGAPSDQTETTDSTVNVSVTVPTRNGYTFLNWNTVAAGTGATRTSGSTFTMPASNITLYAQWAPQTFVIAYNANGGSGAPANQPGVVDATVSVSNTTPSRTGFNFAGWNTAADGSGTSYSGGSTFLMPPANVTLHAQWSAITYTITYHDNDGTGSPAASSHTYLEAVTLSATIPSRAGYWFNGWNTLANGNGSGYVSSADLVMPATDLDLYAQWVPNQYRVVYNANGGTGAPNDQVASTSATVTVSATQPSRIGYTFLSWSTTSAGTPPTYSASATFAMPPSNTTLFAQWQIRDFTLTYNANGGSGVEPATQSGPYQSVLVVDEPATLTRSGYTFIGWNTSPTGSATSYGPGSGFVVPAENTTVYAQWFADTNAIIYNLAGGSSGPSTAFAATGESVTVSSIVPLRPGYTFLRWQTAGGTQYQPGGTFTMPAFTEVLYAVWAAQPFTLSYDANDGSGAPVNQTHDTDSTATVSATLPTRAGYTFMGWNTSAGGGGTPYVGGDSFSMPPNDVTLYAQWVAQSFTLSYDANGGLGAPNSQSISTDATAVVSVTVPNRIGHTFLYWTTTSAGTGATFSANSTFSMPPNDVTLYAQWSLTSYVLTYDANGGSGAPVGGNRPFGSMVTVSSTLPTRAGHTFLYWTTTSAGTGVTFSAGSVFTMPAEDVTLSAQWLAVPAPAPAPQIVPPGGGGSGSTKTPEPSNRDLPDPDTKETRPSTPVTIDPITSAPPVDDDWDTETMRIVDPVTEQEQTTVVTPDGTWELDTRSGLVNFTPADGFFGRAEVEFVITTTKGVTYRARLSVFVARLGPIIPVTGAESNTVLIWGLWLVVAGVLAGAASRRRRLF